jgi:hypothetical protein
MAKPNLSALLNEPAAAPERAEAPKSVKASPKKKPEEVNISAYFPPEVKAALRQVQAKTGKNIKDCMSEAFQMLFRKHNVPVTVAED